MFSPSGPFLKGVPHSSAWASGWEGVFLHLVLIVLFCSSLQQSAERCVSTLLDLIQTKVNYVVQEAIVVIRDIFRKYPNKCVQVNTSLSEALVSWHQNRAM